MAIARKWFWILLGHTRRYAPALISRVICCTVVHLSTIAKWASCPWTHSYILCRARYLSLSRMNFTGLDVLTDHPWHSISWNLSTSTVFQMKRPVCLAPKYYPRFNAFWSFVLPILRSPIINTVISIHTRFQLTSCTFRLHGRPHSHIRITLAVFNFTCCSVCISI